MRKLGALFFGVFLCCGATCVGKISSVSPAFAAENNAKTVYIGGMTAGFTLNMGGAQVIGLCEVSTKNGSESPAGAAGVRAGDIIMKAAGINVINVADLNEILNKTKGKCIDLTLQRGDEELNVEVQPVQDRVSERYKIGVLIRDSVSGVGTVTYIEKDTKKFASLGHAVSGANMPKLTMRAGDVFCCNIIGVSKGMRGKAGELRGMFLGDKSIGTAKKQCECGIFGQIDDNFDYQSLPTAYASSEEVRPGRASIYSTVSGVSPKEYSIEIVKVDKMNRENKNYVIKITDKDLIGATGGIVQGMSGSPILQNGKMVGAVTHVFINDPTRGYGINIDKMLEN